MPAFAYTVLQHGTRRSGRIEAAGETEAAARLRGEGAAILSLRPAGAETSGSLPASLANLLVSKAQLELSLRQLASVLRADVPILFGLETVGNQCSPVLRRAYVRVRDRIRQGTPLSTAFREEAPFIDRVSLGLISVGEANGTLGDMLAYSADLMERSRRLRGDLVQAFSYPCFVILAGLGVAWFMATKVIPKILAFIQGRQGARGGLPPITQALVDVTAFFQSYGLYVLAAPVLAAILLVMARRQGATGEKVDRILLGIPLLGGAFRAHANAMWCRTFGALLGSGVEIVSALEMVERTMGNWFYAAQFRQAREAVRTGRSLTRSIGETALPKLCPMAQAMIATSEQSGGLDQALAEVAAYSEDSLRRRVALLSKLIEPAMYAVVGGMVGFVYFAFFMAMMAAQRSV